MTSTADFPGQEKIEPGYPFLRPQAIEKVFTDCVMDLKRILVLDGIDILPEGFRVRCHDLHGVLPEILMKNSGHTLHDKERPGKDVCKLIAIAKLRDEMARFLRGCELLPPTSLDGKAIVGLQAKPRTWILEGENFFSAYHELHSLIVG